jgi:uncharacterized protein YycO
MLEEFVPGDFILTHRRRMFAALITLAQRRRFRGSDARFAHWSHAALIVGATLGVRRSSISKYRENEYLVVRLGTEFSPECRAAAVAYAAGQVGQAFGFLDMVGASLHLLLGWPLRWVRRNHEICSSLVVKALQKGDKLCEFDPAMTLPADLAKAFDVKTA